MLRLIVQSDGAAARSYYRGSSGEYYAEGQEHAGEWGGLAAERLGLAGRVAGEAFDALCENRHPTTAARITARTKTVRRVGFDLNFHVPKSVSVVYGLSGDRRMLQAFTDSVRETLDEIESLIRTRVRVGGRDETRTTANWLYSLFVHCTTRPVDGVPDPHLHAHAFVFNQTFDEIEGRWKAIELGEVYKNAPYFEAGFHARLSRRLVELGFDVYRTEKGWELSGIPQRVLTSFSRRTSLIERLARELGIDDAELKAELGATTRERKQLQLTLEELRAVWLARLLPEEQRAIQHVIDRDLLVPLTDPLFAEKSVRYAVEHAFERTAVLPVNRLLESALRFGVGQVTIAEIQAALQRHELIIRDYDQERLATTPEVLAEESRILKYAKQGRGSCFPLVVNASRLDPRLSAEQAAVIGHVWDSRDRLILIRGVAGSGKTTLMKSCISGIGENGKAVMVLAPTADASRGVLRREGFADADTVSRFLLDEAFQARARGGVIWVDEAGLLGLKTLDQLFQIASRLEARVVLCGDERQHRSVERGSPLQLLQEHGGLQAATVRDIRRQQGRYRDAVKLLSDGRTTDGFDLLDRHLGWVRELAEEDRWQVIADDYTRLSGQGKTVLVVSPTHAEGRLATHVLRERLRIDGRLDSKELAISSLESRQWTLAERQQPLFYQPGDVIEFHAKVKGFRAGDRLRVITTGQGSVAAVRDDGLETIIPVRLAERFTVYRERAIKVAVGDRVRITKNGSDRNRKRLANGTLSTIIGVGPNQLTLEDGSVLARDFGHIDHGYVITSHASQGKTVDHVLIVQSSFSFAASSREQFYVSASRARSSATVYTDDKRRLRQAIERTESTRSATELTHHDVPRREVWQAWVKARLQWLSKLFTSVEKERTPDRNVLVRSVS